MQSNYYIYIYQDLNIDINNVKRTLFYFIQVHTGGVHNQVTQYSHKCCCVMKHLMIQVEHYYVRVCILIGEPNVSIPHCFTLIHALQVYIRDCFQNSKKKIHYLRGSSHLNDNASNDKQPSPRICMYRCNDSVQVISKSSVHEFTVQTDWNWGNYVLI